MLGFDKSNGQKRAQKRFNAKRRRNVAEEAARLKRGIEPKPPSRQVRRRRLRKLLEQSTTGGKQ